MDASPNPLGISLTALGYITGAAVFFMEARRRRFGADGMVGVALAGLVFGVLAARLAEWGISHWHALASQPDRLFDPRTGGRTFIGGILGGWLAVELAKRRLGIRRSTGDLFALALPAGEAVGRLGCLLNGCCYGTPARLPWSIFQHGAWRHPAQLYAGAAALATLAFLFAVRDRMPREGDLFRLYLLLFGAERFVVELFRERPVVFGGLSAAQWVSLELVVSGALLLALGRRTPRPAETGGTG